jgi:hypothetical protein
VDDCVMREGDWSCLSAQGAWQRCDLGRSPPPTDQQGQLLVAQVGAPPALLANRLIGRQWLVGERSS